MYDFKQPAVAISSSDKDLPLRVSASGRDTRLLALDDDQLDAWNERVAICMVDGGLSQEEAEAIAWREVEGRRAQAVDDRVGPGAESVATGEEEAGR